MTGTSKKNYYKIQARYKKDTGRDDINSIRSFIKDLYQQNAHDFLDPDFSRRIALSLFQDLRELDVESLRDLHFGLTGAINSQENRILFNYSPPVEYSKFRECTFNGCINGSFSDNCTRPSSMPHKLDNHPPNQPQNQNQIPMIQYIRRRIVTRNNDLERRWFRKNQEEPHNKYDVNSPTARILITVPRLIDGITKQLIIRGNLIGTIESVLTDKNGHKSILQTRLESLLHGEFCLPPRWGDIEQVADEKTRIREMAHYIQITTDSMCQASGGILMKLNRKKMNKLKEGDTLIAVKYWEYVNIIQKSYISSIQELHYISRLLENLHPLSDADLNALINKIRNILDDLYSQTEIYYLLAVLSLLEAAFENTKKQTERT